MFGRIMTGAALVTVVAVAALCLSSVMAERTLPKAPDALVINDVELTAVRIDGARCILAQEVNRMALACDFTFANP